MNYKNRRIFVGFIFILGLLTFLVVRSQEKKSYHFILAHNLFTDHPAHEGMLYFAKELKELSNGRMSVTIFPAAQLGTEKDVLELVQLGAISMTKVSSLSLEAFNPLFGILNLPFIFDNQKHYHDVLDSSVGEELLAAITPQRFRGLTYYEAGDRSFYANKFILRPEDIVGLKMRVMDSPSSIQMLKLLGGSPTPMSYGEVYTALQQGVIDGAENNITAITVNRHGEVSKFFSRDQHIFAPDTLIISAPIWNSLKEEDQQILREAADRSKFYQRKLWNKKVAEFEEIAKNKMGVQFVNPDKKPFKDKVRPLILEYSKRGADYARLIRAIEYFHNQ